MQWRFSMICLENHKEGLIEGLLTVWEAHNSKYIVHMYKELKPTCMIAASKCTCEGIIVKAVLGHDPCNSRKLYLNTGDCFLQLVS